MVWYDLVCSLVGPYRKRYMPSGVTEMFFKELCVYERREVKKRSSKSSHPSLRIFFIKLDHLKVLKCEMLHCPH